MVVTNFICIIIIKYFVRSKYIDGVFVGKERVLRH